MLSEMGARNPDCASRTIGMASFEGVQIRAHSSQVIEALGFSNAISRSLEGIHKVSQFDEVSPEGAGAGKVSAEEGKARMRFTTGIKK